MAIFIESSTTSAIVVSSPKGSTSHYTHRLAIEILQSVYRKTRNRSQLRAKALQY